MRRMRAWGRAGGVVGWGRNLGEGCPRNALAGSRPEKGRRRDPRAVRMKRIGSRKGAWLANKRPCVSFAALRLCVRSFFVVA